MASDAYKNTKATDGIIRIYDHQDGHVHIDLNNPPVNALSSQLIDKLYDVLFNINKNKNFKFLSIGGVDQHFSAGADLKERASMSEQEALKFLDKLNNCFDLLENLEIPTIATIHGATLGGGAELALCCDIIVADIDSSSSSYNDVYDDFEEFSCHTSKEEFRVGFPEATLGIIPGAGGTYRIYKKMNLSHAKHWILSGKIFSLEEAVNCGFIDIVDTGTVLGVYTSLYEALLENSRTSLISAKKSMNKCYLENDRKKQRIIELEEYKKTLNSPERKEALRKYKKK